LQPAVIPRESELLWRLFTALVASGELDSSHIVDGFEHFFGESDDYCVDNPLALALLSTLCGLLLAPPAVVRAVYALDGGEGGAAERGDGKGDRKAENKGEHKGERKQQARDREPPLLSLSLFLRDAAQELPEQRRAQLLLGSLDSLCVLTGPDAVATLVAESCAWRWTRRSGR
jgi:hypothetical protein